MARAPGCCKGLEFCSGPTLEQAQIDRAWPLMKNQEIYTGPVRNHQLTIQCLLIGEMHGLLARLKDGLGRGRSKAEPYEKFGCAAMARIRFPRPLGCQAYSMNRSKLTLTLALRVGPSCIIENCSDEKRNGKKSDERRRHAE